MSFIEKYKEGNEFILSPNGRITRLRYAVYAVLLDLAYRFSIAFGIVLAQEISVIFGLLCFVGVFCIVLKFFNYKKRARGIFDNDKWGYIFASCYMLIGVALANYIYLSKLAVKQALLGLGNTNIPSYIGTPIGQVFFYTLTVVGFLMFLTLVFYPDKKTTDIKEAEEKEQAEE